MPLRRFRKCTRGLTGLVHLSRNQQDLTDKPVSDKNYMLHFPRIVVFEIFFAAINICERTFEMLRRADACPQAVPTILPDGISRPSRQTRSPTIVSCVQTKRTLRFVDLQSCLKMADTEAVWCFANSLSDTVEVSSTERKRWVQVLPEMLVILNKVF